MEENDKSSKNKNNKDLTIIRATESIGNTQILRILEQYQQEDRKR